ncbi:MAG: glycosyltransferase, partial [Patescibacteria group bacterium]
HQENRGLAAARNTGIKAAKGEYIAFLDADDMFLPEKVAEQVSALEAHPDYGACYSDIIHFDDPAAGEMPSRFYHHRYRYPSGDIFSELLKRQFINPLTVMARRDVFEKYGAFDESLRRSEDWDLWLRLSRAGVKFLYLDKPLAHYRVRREGNLSSLSAEPDMKEKNLFLFSRLGEKLSDEERKKYDFENVLNGLRKKRALAYLMVGDKARALLRPDYLPPAMRFFVRLLPAKLLQYIFVSFRRLKHRLLLKKL